MITGMTYFDWALAGHMLVVGFAYMVRVEPA